MHCPNGLTQAWSGTHIPLRSMRAPHAWRSGNKKTAIADSLASAYDGYYQIALIKGEFHEIDPAT